MPAEDDDDDDDELDRRDLDQWTAMAPTAGFADRVLAAKAGVAMPGRAPSRRRLVAAVLGAAGAAAVIAVLATRGGGTISDGTLDATSRTTAELGARAVAVAEPTASLRWHVAASGDADITQSSGDVFYRVERGGPFIIHTPAGDVAVTGTCLRIEVIPVNPTKQVLISGAIGAALATAVVVTVYEGRVAADSHGTHTEMVAGARATLGGDGVVTAGGGGGVQVASTAREVAQQDQIIHLRSRVAELERQAGKPGAGHPPRQSEEQEDGRLWHDPSADKLAEWATKCHIRMDEPALDRFSPKRAEDLADRGVEASELDGYNGAMTEVSQQWQALVRALYLAATGDAAGAETLSIEAMQHEIEEKSAPSEHAQVLQKIARERAGLQAPPADVSKTSPLEQMLRAYAALGDQSEQALGSRIGASRAHEIRGDGWGSRSDMSGCPSP